MKVNEIESFKFLSDDNKEGVWLSGLKEDCGRFEDWELFKKIVKVLYSVWCTTSLKGLEIVVPFRYFFFSLAWSVLKIVVSRNRNGFFYVGWIRILELAFLEMHKTDARFEF